MPSSPNVAKSAEHISTTETAKLIRRALLAAFPNWQRFSVRSKRYSGGSSIDVSWTDGPRSAAVSPIVQRFEGATFDGMRDLKEYHDSVLCDAAGKPRLVSFAADYVFVSRDFTDRAKLIEEASAMIRSRCTLETVGGYERFGTLWLSDLAAQVVGDWDMLKESSMEFAFRRVVL